MSTVAPLTTGGALPQNPTSTAAPVDSDSPQPSPTPNGNGGADSGEQALESHEVIELQTFSERKAWIEEKIKFLENLPPIEVFSGLDALREQTDECPGLPSRQKLHQWMAEHDTIEKETEMFDKGELKKLRQLTKAATQRNLSPADTDLIEITLTTIYALDKLLHLLRDRSENLELLTIRLDWEENRTNSWKDRTKILEDLDAFIKTRARWSPAIYENAVPKPEDSPVLTRRGSIASLASIASETSINNPAFSLGPRFKLAELLARDAAQFGARITGLCHGRVATAGRHLDKLIDHSRKPVPDELLDEQERLEEKSTQELDNVGKFAMSLVMQWRKADEIYVETMKDQSAARELYEEIQTAKYQHPTLRQSSAFVSRLESITRRLSVRGNPASKISIFPKPEHPLFPDQIDANESLANSLAAEIVTANTLVEQADKAVKEYRELWEAIKKVESIASSATELSTSFSSIFQRLREGVPADNDEGHPPDLTLDACLDQSRHSVFLALLPSITSEASDITARANKVIKGSHLAFAVLEHESVDPIFKSNVTTAIQGLISLRDETSQISNLVSERVLRLRETRQMSNTLDAARKELEKMRDRLGQQMERASWKQEANGNGAPPTPESPAIELFPTPQAVPPNLDLDLGKFNKLTGTIDSGLKDLAPHLGSQLIESLLRRAKSLRNLYEGLFSMQEISKAVQDQSESMSTIREEYNGLLLRVEDVKQRFTGLTTSLQNDHVSDAQAKGEEASIKTDLSAVQAGVSDFVDGLSKRVRFVSRHPVLSPTTKSTFIHRSVHNQLSKVDEARHLHLSIDLTQLDATVRAESNAYVMRLNGALESVSRASEHLTLTQLAKDLDKSLASTIDTVYQSQEHTKSLKASFNALVESVKSSPSTSTDTKFIHDLDGLILQVDEASRERRLSVSRCFSPLRDILRKMDSASQGLEDTVRQSVYASRVRSVDDAETRYHSWSEEISSLKAAMVNARAEEVKRLEDVKADQERRRVAEEERRAREEAAQIRLEEEKRVQEEERRAEEERKAEMERLEEERLRKEAEEKERVRLENERKEAEEKERLKQEEEERRARELANQERLQQDEADKARLRQERLDMEAKLHRAEALLAEERLHQVERERNAQKHSEEERRKIEAERKQMQLAIKEAQDRLSRAEAEARRAVGEEKRRLEAEIKAMKLDHKKTLEAYKKSKEAAPITKVIERARSGSSAVQEDVADVFGTSAAPSSSRMAIVKENNQMHSLITGLRKRLRSLHINEVARPTKKSASLPTRERARSIRQKFMSLKQDASELPASIENASVNTELQSLNSEIDASADLLDHIDKLVEVTESIEQCDIILSDLLEHVDSYPSLPTTVSTLHISDEEATSEQQMEARLTFTKKSLDTMRTTCSAVPHDRRVVAEQERLQQTWLELEEMASDRLGGKKSRPSSSVSSRPSTSGRSSIASSAAPNRASAARKRASYANLSVSSINVKGGKLAPPVPALPRRSTSGDSSHNAKSRSSSRMSISSNRSVTGPLPTVPLNASVMGSTFASRQRTSSLSSSPAISTPRTPSRGRASSSSVKRTRSPTMSEASCHSLLNPPPRSTTTSTSSWARAPRDSLSSLVVRAMTPQRSKAAMPPRKKYVANPKNKLDVAVGDVINNLAVGINVEGVTETWKDQSGKYWIGNQDPKLCFCRILRSQTVMVRVGGGWTELSKFITNHFADSFRLVPESPGKYQEEKWISSATLLEAVENSTPLGPPKTPEPRVPFVPSFSLLTPSGHSPRSIKSSDSPSVKGSPLTPLQFMRRAEPDPNFTRPGTPSKTPHRTRNPPTIPRPSVWRP